MCVILLLWELHFYAHDTDRKELNWATSVFHVSPLQQMCPAKLQQNKLAFTNLSRSFVICHCPLLLLGLFQSPLSAWLAGPKRNGFHLHSEWWSDHHRRLCLCCFWYFSISPIRRTNEGFSFFLVRSLLIIFRLTPAATPLRTAAVFSTLRGLRF